MAGSKALAVTDGKSANVDVNYFVTSARMARYEEAGGEGHTRDLRPCQVIA